MTGDTSKFTHISPKKSGHVTYGDNNKGRILGVGKIVIILNWYGLQKDPQFILTCKDPIKFGYLSQKLDYAGIFEKEVVHR